MKVVVLVENTSTDAKNLPGRHGLSLLIEVRGYRILYDFGPGRALIHNCQNLGVDLSTVSLGVLSHSHTDHGRGLNDFFGANSSASVHAMEKVGSGYLALLLGFLPVPIGIQVSRQHKARFIRHSATVCLAEGIHLVPLGTVEHSAAWNRNLLAFRQGKLVRDPFDHESALVIEQNGGLHVFCACSHHGVIPVLEAVAREFPLGKVVSYTGGFHTGNPTGGLGVSTTELETLGEQLLQTDVEFWTGHCTGVGPYAFLSQILGAGLNRLETGLTFHPAQGALNGFAEQNTPSRL